MLSPAPSVLALTIRVVPTGLPALLITPMRDRVTWLDLEAELQARPGWRRVGHEYHGPCPVTGAGRDCCFASEGRTGVALGCRQCGGRLAGEVFKHHLAALIDATAREVAPHQTHARPAHSPVRPRRAAVAGL